MLIKNRIVLQNRSNYSHIEIVSEDFSYDHSLELIFQTARDMIQDKNVFISLNGPNTRLCDHNILRFQKDQSNLYKSRLWIKKEWLSHARSLIDESEYFIIYFFDKKYRWNAFLSENRSNDSYINKEPNLYMIISFGQCQFPSIFIKKDTLMINRIVECYYKQGFEIVNSPLW